MERDDTEFDPGKSMQQNVQAWVATMNVKIKQNKESIDELDEMAKEFLKLKTTIENLELKELKTKFFEFRQEVQTAQAVFESKTKSAATRAGVIVGLIVTIVGSVVTAVIIGVFS